jgi:hypothetical protein
LAHFSEENYLLTFEVKNFRERMMMSTEDYLVLEERFFEQ